MRSASPTGASSSTPRRGAAGAPSAGPVKSEGSRFRPRPRPSSWSLSLISLSDFLTEVTVFEHLGLGLQGKLPNRGNIRIVEAVGGTNGKFNLVYAHIKKLLEGCVLFGLLGGRLFEIRRHHRRS